MAPYFCLKFDILRMYSYEFFSMAKQKVTTEGFIVFDAPYSFIQNNYNTNKTLLDTINSIEFKTKLSCFLKVIELGLKSTKQINIFPSTR